MEKKKIKEKTEEKNKLIIVIRIAGEVKIKKDIESTLYNLRLRRKYSAVLVNNEKELLGMIEKVKYFVAYGEINKEVLAKLIKARAKKIDKKNFNAEEIAEKLIEGENLKKLGFKPFFRLHPPRKGIKSKIQYPKGVLGNNKENINKLVERML